MKSTWFGERDRYEFARLLQAAHPNAHPWDIYPRWARCAFLTLRQSVHCLCHGKRSEELEQAYLKEIEWFPDSPKAAEALGALTIGLHKKPHDFLGKTLAEWGILNKWAGQFFTPDAVAEAMSRLLVHDLTPPPLGQQRWINEPACGAGAMVIAFTNELKQNNWYPWQYYVWADDLDQRMFYTCYIQLTLLGVPAIVRNVNTLTQQQFDAAATFVGVLHPPKKRKQEDIQCHNHPATCRQDQDTENHTEPREPPARTPDISLNQGQLF